MSVRLIPLSWSIISVVKRIVVVPSDSILVILDETYFSFCSSVRGDHKAELSVFTSFFFLLLDLCILINAIEENAVLPLVAAFVPDPPDACS